MGASAMRDESARRRDRALSLCSVDVDPTDHAPAYADKLRFSNAEIRDIRELYAKQKARGFAGYTTREIAQVFGITTADLWLIVNRLSYAWVSDERQPDDLLVARHACDREYGRKPTRVHKYPRKRKATTHSRWGSGK